MQEIQAAYDCGDAWLLCKRNDLEAVVERHPLDEMHRLIASGVAVSTLKFWKKGGRGSQDRVASSGTLSPCSSSQAPSRHGQKTPSRAGSRAGDSRPSPTAGVSEEELAAAEARSTNPSPEPVAPADAVGG